MSDDDDDDDDDDGDDNDIQTPVVTLTVPDLAQLFSYR